MGVYNYECVTKQGDIVVGQLSADNSASAVQRLRTMGMLVLDLGEKRSSSGKGFFKLGKRVKMSELSLFSRQLSAMIRAGIPVTRALYTLARQEKHPGFKNTLEGVARNIEGGMSLTEAFGAYPRIFSNFYVSMIHSGEIGGMLDEALLRLSQQLQKDKALRDNIKSATFYPRIVLVFALLMVIGMLAFMVPVFKKFLPPGVELPFITRVVFALSDSIINRWYLWLLCISGIAAGIAYFLKRPASRRLWDRIKFRLPAFGPLIQKSVIARFSRTLSTLLEGGIPIIQALESAGPTSGSSIVAEAADLACKRIQEGKNIAEPLEESGVFPPMATQMIAVGEETGALSSLLEKIAEFYEEEVDIMSKGLMDLVQPFMFIILGIIVGGMLISLYLPIFSVITSSAG
jgi:type IV pilus assembly protein PilC